MANLKAVELLARPPLTNVPERLRILANELPEDVQSLVVVAYPSGVSYLFGEALSHYEVVGLLHDTANGFCSSVQK